jgi:glycosyltransferase involved in cell wall biosynthesis
VIRTSNCAAVIPCLNESASITALVAAVSGRLSSVLVVDDGSADGTARLAKDAGAVVLRHAKNLGKGAALQTGLAHALESGFEWAVTLDGDGQHAPEDLPALFRRAELTGAKMVIGNRMGEAQKMPWLRRSVNRAMSKIISRRAGKFLPDTQSGFRLIHLPTWATLLLEAEKFEVESEMLLAFLAAGERVEFAPVQVLRSNRASHICPLADTLRWLAWWKKFHRPDRRHFAAQSEPVKLKKKFVRRKNSAVPV